MEIKPLLASLGIAACMLGTACAADGPKEMSPDVKNGIIDVISNVTYAQIKTLRSLRPMKMTVLVPRTNEPKPAIVYFPGGGFTSADYEKFIQMRMALAEAGFVVAAAEYRVVPNKFPAILNDAKAAVRYLREHAGEYGIDPNRIGALGDSAGGYVAQMLGATNGERGWDTGDFLDKSSDVQAVVSVYGISDLTNIGAGFDAETQKVHESPAVTEALLVHGPAFGKNPGESIMTDKAKALEASPIGHVDGSEPPFLLMHGDKDPLVSPVQSAQMYEKLKDSKVDAEYIVMKGGKHGDLVWYQPNVIEQVVSWFKLKLGTPAPVGAKPEGAGSKGNLNDNL